MYADDTTTTLAGPTHWEPNSPAIYWTSVSFTSGIGGALRSASLKLNRAAAVAASGVTVFRVKLVTFVIASNTNAGGSGVVVGREIDIVGVPTVVNLPAPEKLPGFGFSNGNFQAQITGTVGQHYRVEATTNLASTSS